MNTPICNFVDRYQKSGTLRLHMPGHKGLERIGVESGDITEIQGADSLYEADGIIRESEGNASHVFGCTTYYSTEGSSQCIRAMLCLLSLYAKESGKENLVWAARNVHKTFLSAVALLDTHVEWLECDQSTSYLSTRIDIEGLETRLSTADQKPAAIYLTSPDYLGNMVDLAAVGTVCRRHGVLLLVDNAHGAYLKFLPHSVHPIDLGADLVCDSAHKTLPVITGGAYLHIGANAPASFAANAKNALALFGSTSPSYLILQSLDAVNSYLADGYPTELERFLPFISALRKELVRVGYTLVGDEWLKLTIAAKAYGYRGTQIADLLRRAGIECEFADSDYTVLMLTPALGTNALTRLQNALTSIPKEAPIEERPPAQARCVRRLSIREAMLSPAQTLPVECCRGRILAAPSVACPPAVPIVVCGEEIDERAIDAFRYYSITTCTVVKK